MDGDVLSAESEVNLKRLVFGTNEPYEVFKMKITVKNKTKINAAGRTMENDCRR